MLDFILTSLISVERIARQISPWALLAGALAIAAVVGLLAAQLRKKASRWISWPVSALLSLIALVITAVLAVGVGLSVPATDSSIFAKAPKYFMSLKTGPLGNEITSYQIELAYSPDIRVDSDAVLAVSRTSPTPAPPTDLQVTATAAPELVLRAPRPCTPSSVPQAPPLNSVCSLVQLGPAPLPARWIVRTSKAGEYLVTVGVSDLFDSAFDVGSPNWHATISRDGELIEKYIHARTGRDWHGGEDRSDIKRVVVRLDSNRRQFRDSGLEIDLSSRQLEIRVNAQTTLGVSAAVYQYMSIAAAAISAALGGGWLWQLANFLRNRQKQPPQHVPFSKRSRNQRP